MAWRAKLIAIDKSGINVLYYDNVTGNSFNEAYDINRFSTKEALQDHCRTVVADRNNRETKTNQMTTALTALIGQDLPE